MGTSDLAQPDHSHSGQLEAEPPRSASADGEDTAASRSWLTRLDESGIAVGLITMLILSRVFAVANWNWEVAGGLVDTFDVNDAISILLGTLFERPRTVGVFLTCALPIAFYHGYWLSRRHAARPRATNGFVIVAMLATTYVLVRSFGLWWVPAIALVVGMVLVGVTRYASAHDRLGNLAHIGRHIGLVAAVAVLGLAMTISTPWMQRERMEIEPDSVMYGYVLKAAPGFLTVLTEDREIVILPDSQVVSRTLVHEED